MQTLSRAKRPLTIVAALVSAVALVAVSGCDQSKPGSTTATTVGTELDDGILTAKVKTVLLADAAVKSFDIKVETRKGEVMLSGFVLNRGQMDHAIQLARDVPGVKAVTNSMTWKDGKATVGNTVDDGIITSRVKAALIADPDIKSFDISVVTRKGESLLSGFVNTELQIDRAVLLARNVDGVISVANEMKVKK